ncbi:MAG: transketolase [Anaerolineae bacterium]
MPITLDPKLRELAAKTIRMLAADGVEQADSGHPGMPMGAADYALTLWLQYLQFNPADPAWPNRDRFILSAGHGSMLLYSLLHLFRFDLPIEELQNFRQYDSKTPGHPEYGLTPGVETSTGPLGQGFANGVGMAIAARMTQERFNTPDHPIFGHYIYGIVSDGDLMEGIASEAASLAGHLGLGNLIYIYDDNEISIEGSTELAFTEDPAARFEAYGWHVVTIDGHDGEQAAAALEQARAETERPSLIVAKTHIGYGSPNKQDSADAHGAPLGAAELAATKENIGWPESPRFYIPDEVYELFAGRVKELQSAYADWQTRFSAWRKANPELAAEYDRATSRTLPDDLEAQLLATLPAKSNATRRLSGDVIQKVAELLPMVVGGSADLAPSTSTLINNGGAIGRHSFKGKNFHFGVREHAMGGVLNGLALYGGYVPFGATFLVFADYMRPSIRLANIMGIQVIYVFTHDSIFVGEDGPTHEPIEQIASLRLIPGMTVIRPADGPEVAAAWAWALRHQDGPTALILTRQGVPAIERQDAFSVDTFNRGAYAVTSTPGRDPDIVLVGTGSELQLAVAAGRALEEKGHAVRVVSMPSQEIYLSQDAAYRESLIPCAARKVVIEAAVRFGWDRIVGSDALFITQESYGLSAPAGILAEKLGWTGPRVTERILAWLK